MQRKWFKQQERRLCIKLWITVENNKIVPQKSIPFALVIKVPRELTKPVEWTWHWLFFSIRHFPPTRPPTLTHNNFRNSLNFYTKQEIQRKCFANKIICIRLSMCELPLTECYQEDVNYVSTTMISHYGYIPSNYNEKWTNFLSDSSFQFYRKTFCALRCHWQFNMLAPFTHYDENVHTYQIVL